jgi:DNA-binding response OmpR family regulator
VESVRPSGISSAGNETILLVEDEDSVRAFVKTVLERFGYRVLDAQDAETALAKLATLNARIDLLLTDVVLPKMDGPELARRVAGDHPATPVLFMSGYPERMVTAAGALEDGLELIEKPFTAQAILARVRLTLGGDVATRRGSVADIVAI